MYCGKRSQHPAASGWISDETSHRCINCDKEFTYMVRRHHCRACGALVCSSCSGKYDFLPQYGYSLRHPVRVCKNCHSRKRNVIDLERDMFILCKKSRFSRAKTFSASTNNLLIEFASKLRQSKSTDGFNENLLRHCIGEFERYFMAVYEPLNAKITDMLGEISASKCNSGANSNTNQTFKFSDEQLDRVLTSSMSLLRSWKNLENDIPNACAQTFLKKVELVECFRYPWPLSVAPLSSDIDIHMHTDRDRHIHQGNTNTNTNSQGKPPGLHKVVSSPCISLSLTGAQASFHRHPISTDPDKGLSTQSLLPRRNSSTATLGLGMPPPSPCINTRRTKSNDEYSLMIGMQSISIASMNPHRG